MPEPKKAPEPKAKYKTKGKMPSVELNLLFLIHFQHMPKKEARQTEMQTAKNCSSAFAAYHV